MEPEGVVDVLRKLLEALAPGGDVVDLIAVPPNEQIELGGEVIGEIDGSAFFPRALAAAAGLEALVNEGLLASTGEERFPILIRYPSGKDLVDDVADREYTRMPTALASRVKAIDEPIAIREWSLVRSFRRM